MTKRPRRFAGLQVVVMLRSIGEDDFKRKSKTEEGCMLDWELCSSDKMSGDEETEQFDDAQPIIHVGDLQTADTNFETNLLYVLMMILVRMLLKIRKVKKTSVFLVLYICPLSLANLRKRNRSSEI